MTVNNELTLEPIQEIIAKTKLKHIAIIMDGNRRWAKKHKLPVPSGHSAGVKSLKNIVRCAGSWGLKYLTVYAFSTENWGRKEDEVNFLMFLLGETIKQEIKELHENSVKLRIIGNLDGLNKDLQKSMKEAMKLTENNTGLNFQVALNYGSRDEITRAVAKIVQDAKEGKVSPQDITDGLISSYLYTSEIPDPDLLIRTAGEHRLSNYLLWQSAYAEIYVTEILWPDFGKNEFEASIYEFARRERRFGKD